MDRIYKYTVPIGIDFGPGAIEGLGRILAELKAARPLLVCDQGIRECGLLDKAIAASGPIIEDCPVYDAVASNPREENVLDALDRYQDEKCDGIVAIGGGSVIDAAKGVGLLASNQGDLDEFDVLKGGTARIRNGPPPLIAVPTTAGTGSEVSRGALIITTRDGITRKMIAASPLLVPRHAILDPNLTLSLPALLTAGSGMDALCHAIEEYLSPRMHPVVDSIALGALERIARNLPIVMKDPGNIDGRGEMLMGAMMAGIGFEKGLGIGHSMSHAIGALHNIHHGVINATLLPVSFEFNREQIAENLASTIAGKIGLDSAVEGNALDSIIAWSKGLNKEFAIPSRLRDLGVPGEDREVLVELAMADHCHRTNPRRCETADMEEFWERAW
ncbi:MAG: iron-containing alcohol dehydrogenase [Planctomycetes bacterium]|nr:iron-containing alcohol dehydrogenase [Planctomycetota bacterium]